MLSYPKQILTGNIGMLIMQINLPFELKIWRLTAVQT